MDCPSGRYQPDTASAACLPCVPGKFKSAAGKTECVDCAADTFSKQAGSSSCENCGVGEKSEVGSAKCVKCDAGEAGTGINGTCQSCDKGRYRNASMDAADCSICPAGWSSDLGSTKCRECQGGRYNDEDGESCTDCLEGRYRNSQMIATQCKPCPKGQHQDKKGLRVCLDCASGRYNEKEAQVDCFDCPKGWYRPGAYPDRTKCTKTEPGTYTDNTESSFQQDCAAGKYTDEPGMEMCTNCPSGWYQKSSRKKNCLKCKDKLDSKPGASVCFKPEYKIPSDCNDDQYLNVSNSDRNEHDCVICPPGGSCVGPVFQNDTLKQRHDDEVKALFGWSRCPAPQQLIFAKCKRPSSCLGAPNVKLEIFKKGVNLALESRNESCAIGHVQNSSLNLRCSQCAPNFAAPSGGSSGTCVSCEKQKGAIVLVALAAIFAVIIFLVFIALKMKSS